MIEFRKLELILIYLTGGQSARSLEILSIRHGSSEEKEGKNVFIEDGTIVFVTRYHKRYMLSENVKIIYRYLPRKIRELVMYYL